MLFADLLPRARAGQWTLPVLIEQTQCGARCGLCRPYLAAMLHDGRTVFDAVLSPLDDAGEGA